MQSNASGWLIVPNSSMRCSHFQLYRSEHANYRPLICFLQARLRTLTLLQPSKILHWYDLNSLVVILDMMQNTGREESRTPQLLDVWYHPLARVAVKYWSG